MTDVAILDVDGTLVDTNYQHAIAWYRAFRRYDLVLPLWRIHRHVGMGGDQLVPAVAGDEVERKWGDHLRAAWSEEFEPMLAEIAAFDGATDLLADVRARGLRIVLASSGKAEHVDRFLDLIEGREFAQAWTTSDDVERTKPAPDLVQVALRKVGGGPAVLVGDSPWDCIAAGKLDVPAVAVRTGGFATEELEEAGAAMVLDSLQELRARLDEAGLTTGGTET